MDTSPLGKNIDRCIFVFVSLFILYLLLLCVHKNRKKKKKKKNRKKKHTCIKIFFYMIPKCFKIFSGNIHSWCFNTLEWAGWPSG